MKTQTLSPPRVLTLLNALHVAAERFDEHAKQFRDMAARHESLDEPARFAHRHEIMHPASALPMAEQFERQAAETREIHTLIQGDDLEDGEDVEVVLRILADA